MRDQPFHTEQIILRMITVHVRGGRLNVVLNEPETLSVSLLREGIAEALVAAGEADRTAVGDLRLALELENGSWKDITSSKDSLQNLGVTDKSTIGFVVGEGDFSYDPIRDEDDE